MREEPKEVILEDDPKVNEEKPVYADDKQEYMHWHYKLNHPSYAVMSRMKTTYATKKNNKDLEKIG
jgi:hypothetical protein